MLKVVCSVALPLLVMSGYSYTMLLDKDGDIMDYCIKCGNKVDTSLLMIRGAACQECRSCGFTMPVEWFNLMDSSIAMYNVVLVNERDTDDNS